MFTWFPFFPFFRRRRLHAKVARLLAAEPLPATPRSWEPPVPPQAPMCRHHPHIPLLEEHARPGRYFCPLCAINQRHTDPVQRVPGVRPFHKYRLEHVETEVLPIYNSMPEVNDEPLR